MLLHTLYLYGVFCNMSKILNVVGWIALVLSSVLLIITGVSVSDISNVVTLAGGAVAAIIALIKPLWSVISKLKNGGK